MMWLVDVGTDILHFFSPSIVLQLPSTNLGLIMGDCAVANAAGGFPKADAMVIPSCCEHYRRHARAGSTLMFIEVFVNAFGNARLAIVVTYSSYFRRLVLMGNWAAAALLNGWECMQMYLLDVICANTTRCATRGVLNRARTGAENTGPLLITNIC